jgi:hypothetical protein
VLIKTQDARRTPQTQRCSERGGVHTWQTRAGRGLTEKAAEVIANQPFSGSMTGPSFVKLAMATGFPGAGYMPTFRHKPDLFVIFHDYDLFVDLCAFGQPVLT